MEEGFFMITNLLLALLLFIPYHLSLSYIGAEVSFKKTIIPSLLLGLSAFFIRTILQVPPVIYIVSMVFICAVLMITFNKINYLLSFIGSILSFTTFIVSSLLIACPVLIALGYEISTETKGMTWLLLNFAEFFVPTIVMIIIKIIKFNLSNFLRTI